MLGKLILMNIKKLYNLYNNLLYIIKKLKNLLDIFIRNKKFKKDIVDKKRISIILRNIKKKSKMKKIDPKITQRIWISMIKAFIDYEYRNFNKK